MDARTKKLEANSFGNLAEELVSREYVRRGYAVLERNWRLGRIEIDIIVRKDAIVALVEVKARKTDEEDALTAVNQDKRKRMIKAADVYLRRLKGDVNYRFDIATCVGTPENNYIEIYEDAFLATDIF